MADRDPVHEFLVAACVPRDGWHSDGTVDRAETILRAHPEIAGASIACAAVRGDDAAVRRFLARDPALATATSGPYDWDALTYLCFSNYLKLDRAGSEGFMSAATALLDAGASANTGWWDEGHRPHREWEPVLYGAAGIAHHAPLTRLLLERGAKPNDGEVVYHAPETHDNEALRALVETGKLTEEDLTLMLIRKHDWHDVEGAKYLLERGANPNRTWRHGMTAFHHALARDNALAMFETLLDRGADPRVTSHGLTGVARAAREGRGDLLELFETRGVSVALEGVDALIAACARGDGAAARSIAAREPEIARRALAMGGDLLARFAGTGNTPGVAALLDLGIPVAAPFVTGDGYWDEPPGSLAIHVAAWRCRPSVVELLLSRGSPVDAPDANGRTPLMLAIKACMDSYWSKSCSPESIRMLLDAGASAHRIAFPTGNAMVDEVLNRFRKE